MFYGFTAWLFWRKKDRLSRLVAMLMLTICLCYLKDVVVIENVRWLDDFFSWSMMTAIDMLAVPMYAFILMELVRPGMVTVRLMLIHEAPFVLLPVLMAVTHSLWFYYILVAYAAVYGTYYLVWTAIAIPKYHRQLKERFSYTENINLNWLRLILMTFYIILALWILDCLVIHIGMECIYMLFSLVLWMVIDYYIYKHENVIDELSETESSLMADEARTIPDLNERITALFRDNRIYLDPHLKLSDIAKAVGSNRSYVSSYFNRDLGTTFYDYVNGLRIDYACQLLRTTDLTIKLIAEQCGYNSPNSFIRVFSKIKGVSPTAYRSMR